MTRVLFSSIAHMVHSGTTMIIGLLPITITGRRALEEFVLIELSDDAKRLLGLTLGRQRHFEKSATEMLPGVDVTYRGGVFTRGQLAHVLDATGLAPLEMIPTNFTTIIIMKTAREAYQLGLIGAPKSDELAIFGKGTSVTQFIGSIGGEVRPMGELTIGAYFRKIAPANAPAEMGHIAGKQAVLGTRGLYDRRMHTRS